MTENQYKKLAENFAKYADVSVHYHRYFPFMNRKVEATGRLKGIGVGCNAGTIILAKLGFVYAIPFADVNFPKSNHNFQSQTIIFRYMKKIFHFICEHPVRILVTLALLPLMFHWGAIGLLIALPISIMWENVDF